MLHMHVHVQMHVRMRVHVLMHVRMRMHVQVCVHAYDVIGLWSPMRRGGVHQPLNQSVSDWPVEPDEKRRSAGAEGMGHVAPIDALVRVAWAALSYESLL